MALFREFLNMKPRKLIITLSLILPLFAAGQLRITREEYISKYTPFALQNRDAYGVPASITIAQGLLESDNGNSRLAVQANNHFGIKCKSEWTGPTIRHDDDARNECFRKYASAAESYRDHSVFLSSSSRYASLFRLAPTDYQGWAYGLKAAGYATAPDYAVRLIKIIEDNRLFLLDAADAAPEVAAERPASAPAPASGSEPVAPAWNEGGRTVDVDNYVVSMQGRSGYSLYSNNGSVFVVAGKGDTYDTLAAMLGISAWRLRKFNDASREAAVSPGDMVYIKKKASKAINGKLIHIAEEGETLHSVSQRYGIRLSALASMNNRAQDGVLYAGQQLRLM